MVTIAYMAEITESIGGGILNEKLITWKLVGFRKLLFHILTHFRIRTAKFDLSKIQTIHKSKNAVIEY